MSANIENRVNGFNAWSTFEGTCNWRIRLIHHPGVMVRLREADWDGFLLKKDDLQAPEQRDSLDTVQVLLGAISKDIANPNP